MGIFNFVSSLLCYGCHAFETVNEVTDLSILLPRVSVIRAKRISLFVRCI